MPDTPKMPDFQYRKRLLVSYINVSTSLKENGRRGRIWLYEYLDYLDSKDITLDPYFTFGGGDENIKRRLKSSFTRTQKDLRLAYMKEHTCSEDTAKDAIDKKIKKKVLPLEVMPKLGDDLGAVLTELGIE